MAHIATYRANHVTTCYASGASSPDSPITYSHEIKPPNYDSSSSVNIAVPRSFSSARLANPLSTLAVSLAMLFW